MRIAKRTVSHVDYDAELQSHNGALLPACAIRSPEHVLDIGCGTGQTTREAARLAATGSALGVDITEPMIVRARVLAAAEGLHNLLFEHGDAQAISFLPQHFDVAISRACATRWRGTSASKACGSVPASGS